MISGIKWLARKIELIPFQGEPEFYTLSILSFFLKEKMGKYLIVTDVDIAPFLEEVEGVAAIDFVPVLKEFSPGVYRLEGVQDAPLCGVG